MAREDFEARDDAFSCERLYVAHGRSVGDLYLQRALSKAETEGLGDVRLHLGFEDDVVACDTKVDVALADEGGNVGRREEDAVGAGAV